MIRMVKVFRQSVAFCKYVIAGLLWLAVIFFFALPSVPVYPALLGLVLVLMAVSAVTGVEHAPLVVFYNRTFARKIPAEEVYINMYSMRFAHIVAVVMCILALVSFYWITPVLAVAFTILQAVLQTVASFGYCSAQKLYECVVCNSNCCRFGKKIKSITGNDSPDQGK